MTWPWLLAGGILVLALIGLYLSSTAGRLDRLHRRIDTSRLSLDSHLLRRSSVALEVAASGVLDPASSLLVVDAAHAARTAVDGPAQERAMTESVLTAALGAALADPADVLQARTSPVGDVLMDELAAACIRVELSRRFHNDAVRACRQLRRQRSVRWFRLAGHTPLPSTWEMDDTLPSGLRTGQGLA
ncbi:MAG: hypothetical protein KGP12_00245 [Actinomycetales bacterium]|nr:hypothetical protein [Actinomycetales bacterium]